MSYREIKHKVDQSTYILKVVYHYYLPSVIIMPNQATSFIYLSKIYLITFVTSIWRFVENDTFQTPHQTREGVVSIRITHNKNAIRRDNDAMQRVKTSSTTIYSRLYIEIEVICSSPPVSAQLKEVGDFLRVNVASIMDHEIIVSRSIWMVKRCNTSRDSF